MYQRTYGAARPLPRCIQPSLGGLWECVWFLRRAPIGRSKMLWVHALKLRSPASIDALQRWWLLNHWAISDWERRRRRRNGQGNVLLVRCADRALVLTNARKAVADALEFEIRKQAFAPAGLRPRMQMHHFRDGFLFHDLFIRYYSPDGSKKRVHVQPSTEARRQLSDAVHRVCHRDQPRFQRKPIAIIRAYNQVVQPWWDTFRYCDWSPDEIKRLDRELFGLLLRRTSSALRLRNLRTLRKDAARPEDERLAPEKRPPVEVLDKTRWYWWVRNRAYRLKGRRIWRLGAESLRRDRSSRGARKDAVRDAAAALPEPVPRKVSQAVVVGHTFRQAGSSDRTLRSLEVQALEPRFKNRRFSIGIGLTREDRADPPPVGKIITFEYRLENGIPRYPSYVRSEAAA